MRAWASVCLWGETAKLIEVGQAYPIFDDGRIRHRPDRCHQFGSGPPFSAAVIPAEKRRS